MQLLEVSGAIATRANRMAEIDVLIGELGAQMGILQAEMTTLSNERTTLVAEWTDLRVQLFDAFAAALAAGAGSATTFAAVGAIMDQQQGA
jgi:hypothetical protein